MVASDVQAGRLAILTLSGVPYLASSAYGIVSRSGHSLSPGAERLLQILREQDRDSMIPGLP